MHFLFEGNFYISSYFLRLERITHKQVILHLRQTAFSHSQGLLTGTENNMITEGDKSEGALNAIQSKLEIFNLWS